MSSNCILQVISISTALVAAGGIASLSLFDVPLLRSQPASRSLPLIRWLFSRGSHIFPTAAGISSAGFAYLAYDALPSASRTSSALLSIRGTPAVYLAAAALSISIGPFTSLMIPTNFALIQKNEELGGSRSVKSARHGVAGRDPRSADESVQGKNDVSEMSDLSLPQERTRKDSSRAEDEEVSQLLDKFGKMNAVRSVLLGLGGIVGLLGALTA
jgi:hypothetical protein